MDYEEEYFTKIGYQGGYNDSPIYDVRAGKIANMCRPYSVLDVGCARGFVVRRLLDWGIPAWGLDISQYCKTMSVIPNNHVVASADRLPFENNSFDLLYCEGVLEHIEEEKMAQVMAEFKRVARRRMLQVSLVNHPQDDPGHICLKDLNWWFSIVPDFTWLFAGDTGTQDGNFWIYKG